MNSLVFQTASAIILSLGGGAALIFALSNWLGKVWAERLMEKLKSEHAQTLKNLEANLTRVTEDRRRKLEQLMHHYERQVEEFYGPLLNMIHQVFVANHIQSEISKNLPKDKAESAQDYFNENYFSPMHDEIRQIFRKKLYLVEGDTIPESFYQYLKHAAQERDQRMLWKKYGLDTSFLAGEPWPSAFYGDIQMGFEVAMKNYEACLNGLKADEKSSR